MAEKRERVDPSEVVGVCDNPRGYYYGWEITRFLADAEKEECDMRRCWGCPYLVGIHELRSWESEWREDEEEDCVASWVEAGRR